MNDPRKHHPPATLHPLKTAVRANGRQPTKKASYADLIRIAQDELARLRALESLLKSITAPPDTARQGSGSQSFVSRSESIAANDTQWKTE